MNHKIRQELGYCTNLNLANMTVAMKCFIIERVEYN